MSQPLGELRSREVFNLPDNTTKKVRFGGVKVIDTTTGQIVFIMGPVDMVRYHTFVFRGVNPRTGLPFERDGPALLVVQEDGEKVEKFWNLISRRAQQQLLPDLESGEYLN